MKCKICGKKEKKYIKVKGATICPDCYEALPRLIQDNASNLTIKQIENSCRILKRNTSHSGYWGIIGEWRDEDSIIVSNKAMIIRETEINYSDISKVELVFHPTKKSYSDWVVGYTTLKIETEKPKIKLEVRLADDDNNGNPRESQIRYKIHGSEITYFFNPIDILLINGINNVISGKKLGLDCERNTYVRYTEEYEDYRGDIYVSEEEKIRRQEREDEIRRDNKFRKDRREEQEARTQREEQQKQKEAEREQRRRENYKRQQDFKSKKGNSKTQSEFDLAKEMFGLEIPYTEKELRRRRNVLIKKIHPDAGGTVEDAVKINEYYELLKKFAV